MRWYFKRVGDNKVFHIVEGAHWVKVMAEDGEVDSIKWLGGDDYVSCEKEFSYVIIRQDKEAK